MIKCFEFALNDESSCHNIYGKYGINTYMLEGLFTSMHVRTYMFASSWKSVNRQMLYHWNIMPNQPATLVMTTASIYLPRVK